MTSQLLERINFTDEGMGRGVTSAAHDACLRALLAEANDVDLLRRVTEELSRLEDERTDFTAIRDVAIHRLAKNEGYGYARIGAAAGLTKERGAQLVRRAAETYPNASRHVAKIRRRVSGERVSG